MDDFSDVIRFRTISIIYYIGCNEREDKYKFNDLHVSCYPRQHEHDSGMLQSFDN